MTRPTHQLPSSTAARAEAKKGLIKPRHLSTAAGEPAARGLSSLGDAGKGRHGGKWVLGCGGWKVVDLMEGREGRMG
jgi:hypothetical protein